MIFSCFPPDEKCEWNHLSGFVARYNDMFGTAYRRSACLDVETRDEKEPELLMEAPGENPIVIERKSVVWPPEYFSDHRNKHDLLRFFVDRVPSAGNPLAYSAYQLIVDEESLKGKTKKQVSKLAEQIAAVVLSDKRAAKSASGVSSRTPIPWCFRPVLPQERDRTVPETGIGIIIIGEDPEPSEILQRIEAAKSGYAKEFDRLAQAAAE